MKEFSIKDLENLSGVKAHTIRMWEQRYNLFDPTRTETNIRLYSGTDLKSLLNISLLTKMGFRIGKISKMTEEEIEEIVREKTEIYDDAEASLNSLKLSMLNYDEVLFSRVVEDFEKKNGFERAYVELLTPFLTQIGMLWQTNSLCPAQEHFISNLIRQKIYARVDKFSNEDVTSERTYVLYLPEEEIHDLALLMFHYLLKDKGQKAIFLGQSVPFEDLLQVAGRLDNITFVSFFTTHPTTDHLEGYFKKVVTHFSEKDCQFHFAGYLLQGQKSPNKDLIHIHPTARELVDSIF